MVARVKHDEYHDRCYVDNSLLTRRYVTLNNAAVCIVECPKCGMECGTYIVKPKIKERR